MKNNKTYKFFSNDEKITSLLEKFYKENAKIYKKIIDSISLLSNFDKKIDVDIYDVKDTENENYIRLWCSDKNDNIFIFYVFSNNKKDLYKMIQLTNANEIIYDISLSKKFVLNKENINFIKSGNTYSFKYGRLITDEKTFYSIYLGDNIGYQIIIDFENEDYILSENILNYLNDMKNRPTFNDFIKLFENLISNNIKIGNIKVSAYKDFKRIGYLESYGNENKVKKLQK